MEHRFRAEIISQYSRDIFEVAPQGGSRDVDFPLAIAALMSSHTSALLSTNGPVSAL
jgi:hypothetical protein